MKIKAIPVKSETLCKKCRFSWRNHCVGRHKKQPCEMCQRYNALKMYCGCTLIENGEPCKAFKRNK